MSNNRGCNDENCTTGSCGSCSHNSAAITKETSNQLSSTIEIINMKLKLYKKPTQQVLHIQTNKTTQQQIN